jgi:CubicO group peptidase (beta-lactamase class C family)
VSNRNESHIQLAALRRSTSIGATIVLALVATLPHAIAFDDPAAKAAGPKPGPTAEQLGAEDISNLLEPIRAAHEIPALAAAIVRDDKLIAIGATGVRRAGKPDRVGLTDRFHLGSCTKSMTATLCAMLVEQGKLSWGDTVAEVFADQIDDIRPAWREVTLEQLLCHRSGLPEDRTPDAVYFKLRGLRGDMRAQRREAVGIIFEQDPAAAPGEKFMYSNAGVTVAGAMAERVTGQPYETLLRTMLFEPLGMKTAGFGPPGETKTVDQPWGHNKMTRLTPIRPGPLADNPLVITPAGCVHCSLVDWGRYASMHLAGARRASGEPTANAPQLLKPETFKTLYTDKYNQNYAFGWGLADSDAGLTLSHAGSNGMWFAVVYIAPEQNTALLVAMNTSEAMAQEAVELTKRELKRWLDR